MRALIVHIWQLFFLLGFLGSLTFISATKHYVNRKHLNETFYGKTRFAVDDFIDHHRMNLLERLLKKNKHLFYKSPENSFHLEGMFQHQLFQSVISPDDRVAAHLDECSSMPEGRSCYDRALAVLKRNAIKYNNTAGREMREELEAYVYIRDKILEYASEVLNTTVVSCMGGDGVIYFYYLPKSPILMVVNERGYIRPPHDDYYRFVGFYDRPFVYEKPAVYHNIARLYSATLYFSDVPDEAGGIFEWYDFPNNHKLPPAKTSTLDPKSVEKDPRYTYHEEAVRFYSPSFDDPDLNITRISARKGKLLLFSAQDDIHGVREYLGTKERWALMFGLSNKETMDSINRDIIPQHLLDKKGPIVVTY